MPPKKRKIEDIRTSPVKESDSPGSVSRAGAGSPQPGGAGAGSPRPGGAGAESPRPGGAGAESPRPGGPGAGSPQPGGAGAGSPRPGGAGAESPRPGGAGAESPRPGGAGAESPRPGGAEAESPQPDEAGASQTAAGRDTRMKKEHDAETPVKVKGEEDGDTKGRQFHKGHSFRVKFKGIDLDEYDVSCHDPCTVLEAIKSTEKYKEEMRNKWSDENVVIRLGQGDEESTVATHFPCTCISDGELVTISCQRKTAEKIQDQNYTIYPREEYSVFYIDTKGGENAKSKNIFRNHVFTNFKYLCVYGEKGMTVEEALKRDGRFTDDLGDFFLSDNDHPKIKIERKQPVDNQDDKKLKLCYRLKKKIETKEEKTQQENKSDTVSKVPMKSPCASGSSKCTHDSGTVSDVARQRGISLMTVLEKKDGVNTEEEISKQFPDLIKLLESRFPGDSYQKELDLKKKNFGKIQASFSEVHRVRKLLELGNSVCKVIVEGVCQGTGFVLFDNFILTNAHLFNKWKQHGDKLMKYVNVTTVFNYEDDNLQLNWNKFQVKSMLDVSYELDYIILELHHDAETENKEVPPGLLKKFGPMPQNGEACIIGQPAGGVKKMDPTCIIEKEKRFQAVVAGHLITHEDKLFTLLSISQLIRNQGIENIMMGGNKAEQVATYNTFMYYGSSGSPVFDGQCRVFGLHTGGYVCRFENREEHVIEYAHPLLTIFECFVSNMKQHGNEELLKRVQEEAKGNPYLEKIVEGDEPMDVDEE